MNRHARGQKPRKGSEETTMTNEETATTTETAAVAEQGANVAPEKASSKKGASQKKAAPKVNPKKTKPAAKKTAKDAKPASKKASKAKDAAAREGSKKQIVLDLLRRKEGATMAEIARATGWQNHSIRGFMSGTLSKKMDLDVESTKNAAGERTYRIK